jgi:hypothetical protein
MSGRTGGDGKTEKIIGILLLTALILLPIGIPLLSASTLSPPSQTPESPDARYSTSPVPLDMLIFLSPQYANDADINNAIESYIDAVNADLQWNLRLIMLTPETNTVSSIDSIIEEIALSSPLKACMMVGEDTATALGGYHDSMVKPSTIPWIILGGNSSYDLSPQGIISKPHTVDICVSLLYPTSTLTYAVKKTQLIDVFSRFSTQRTHIKSNPITVFESSDINRYSHETYESLSEISTLYYQEDPSTKEVQQTFTQSHMGYFLHGHSNPSGTTLNASSGLWFTPKLANRIQTPLMGIDGCYVNGWWSTEIPTEGIVTSSIDLPWYGSVIFSNTHVHVMALGLLSQQGSTASVSFIDHVLPDLCKGKTLAEAMIGDPFFTETIIVGDPTFHFIS